MRYEEIIGQLKETGCYIKENDSGLHRLRNAIDESSHDKVLPEDEIKKVLAPDNPETAFWKCVVSDKDAVIPLLKRWLDEKDKRFTQNSAFALGMIACF